MSVAIAVIVLVDGEPVDAADLIDAVSALTSAGVLQVDWVSDAVRFTAEDRRTLGGLAEPLLTWWQSQGSGAVLQLLRSTQACQADGLPPPGPGWPSSATTRPTPTPAYTWTT